MLTPANGLHQRDIALALRDQLDSAAESSLLRQSLPFLFRRDHDVIIVYGIGEKFKVAAVILIWQRAIHEKADQVLVYSPQ